MSCSRSIYAPNYFDREQKEHHMIPLRRILGCNFLASPTPLKLRRATSPSVTHPLVVPFRVPCTSKLVNEVNKRSSPTPLKLRRATSPSVTHPLVVPFRVPCTSKLVNEVNKRSSPTPLKLRRATSPSVTHPLVVPFRVPCTSKLVNEVNKRSSADRENRTPARCLGSIRSTTKLYPQRGT